MVRAEEETRRGDVSWICVLQVKLSGWNSSDSTSVQQRAGVVDESRQDGLGNGRVIAVNLDCPFSLVGFYLPTGVGYAEA